MGSALSSQKAATAVKDLKYPINLDHFETMRMVGMGAYGEVNAVSRLSPGPDTEKLYAMKTLSKVGMIEKKSLERCAIERDVMVSLSMCPFCIHVHYAFQDARNFYMVLDMAQGGSLEFKLEKKHVFQDKELALIAYEASFALSYMHSKGYIHRDIKPDNLLLDEKGHVAITDFNLAVKISSRLRSKGMAGTLPYIAPEIASLQKYGPAADWWSLGITLYRLATGKFPWKPTHTSRKRSFKLDKKAGNREYAELICCQEIPYPDTMSSKLKSLLRGLLKRDAHARFGGDDVRAHRFCASRYEHKDVLERTVKVPSGLLPDQHLSNNFDAGFALLDDETPKAERSLTPEEEAKVAKIVWDINVEDPAIAADLGIAMQQEELVRATAAEVEAEEEQTAPPGGEELVLAADPVVDTRIGSIGLAGWGAPSSPQGTGGGGGGDKSGEADLQSVQEDSKPANPPRAAPGGDATTDMPPVAPTAEGAQAKGGAADGLAPAAVSTDPGERPVSVPKDTARPPQAPDSMDAPAQEKEETPGGTS